jgi:asparagine synthase (glutamine-hydrolysing)
MCGLVGAASLKPIPQDFPLDQMRDALAHRGPDGFGSWWSPDGRICMGHRRLALVDLSSTGHQPMEDATKQHVIVFNGEIYNFRPLRDELRALGHAFRGTSDTEVLLAAYRQWGEDCVVRLNGMFSFVIADVARGEIFFARDRMGKKPLYIARVDGMIVWCSELKALFRWKAFPRVIDEQAANYYFALGYVPSPLSILRNVEKLPAATIARFDMRSGSFTHRRYWTAPGSPQGAAPRGIDDLVAEFDQVFSEAVRLRLAADVPVGILLSGGVDSALTAAYAARQASSDLRAYTVTFPDFPEFDESAGANRVATKLGIPHVQVPLDAGSIDVDTFDHVLRHYDEPLADSSIVTTYLVSRAVATNAKGALSGDGGDELFGGYPHYLWLRIADTVRRLGSDGLRRATANAAERLLPVGVRGRHHLMGLAGEARNSIAHVNLYFARSERQVLLVPPAAKNDAPEAYRRTAVTCELTPLAMGMYTDMVTTLGEGYLAKVDRSSMMASLEVRSPFLDTAVVDFALTRLPDSMKISTTARKIFLNAVAGKVLPGVRISGEKRGFALPVHEWMEGKWGTVARDLIASAPRTLLSGELVASLLASPRTRRRNSNRLFAIIAFETWRRQHDIRMGSPEVGELPRLFKIEWGAQSADAA